jgi:uncharacterized protein
MSEKPNRLIAEKSPYLLQHALNPVDGYPWGTEAFDRARKEDKPIFLSIGYSTCHWCHVMAHESFGDAEIAGFLNRWFVSIKVDREERPDIDQMYMAAIQMMAGSGGWPMSVFLMPDGSPFYAGTYFPPRSSHQRPGFADLLTALNTAWRERRDDIRQTAAQLVARLNTESTPTGTMPADGPERCFNLLAESYDAKEGGFGEAPKFPRPAVFTFLFDWYRRSGAEAAKGMALHTLCKMAGGGMYDHLGGGFHRYSVDNHWFVPHFEKMLYDQSQLAHAYLDAYLLTRDENFARVAREIFEYVVRDMQDPAGGFYSAEDADSVNPYTPEEHGEGAFYLWTEEELHAILSPEAADLFCYVHGVEKNGNVSQDPLGEFAGRNILYRAHTTAETADRFDLPGEEIETRLALTRQVLLRARSERTRPHRDDKIISGWNGLLIGALARGSRILQDPKLIEAAIRAATFIKDTLYDTRSQTLMRRYRDGEAGLAGQLDDYGYLVASLLDLYQACHDPRWLQWAVSLTEQQIRLFWNDNGGFFYDSVADSSLKVRMRGIYDGAEPAGNSVAAHNLLRLARLRSRDDWQRMAWRLIGSFTEIIDHYPPALPLMLSAWQQREGKPLLVVVAGKQGAADTEALLRVAEHHYEPHRLVLLADGGENQSYLAEKLPFLELISGLENRATAYVCVDFSCKRPTHDPEELKQQIGVIPLSD